MLRGLIPGFLLAPDCQRSISIVGCYYCTTIVGGQVEWLALVSLGHFSSRYWGRRSLVFLQRRW